MDNLNIDNEALNNLKNMMGEDKVNDALSQISPDMIKNFSKMMNNNSTNSNSSNTSNNTNKSSSGNVFGDIDMETFMKIKSAFDSMNNSNDPRNNLLNSLKPYMRNSRKEDIDKYANFLKMANVMKNLNNNN